MPRVFAAVLFSAVAGWAAADPLQALIKLHDEASEKYDTALAEKAFWDTRAHVEANPSGAGDMALARAAVLLATLKRWELGIEVDERTLRERRVLAREIDLAGEAGLAAAERLPESSEKHRMIADLYGAMIRSDFQGKKYGDRMTAAAERAVELDDKNPLALVTSSKRLIFAKERRGGDMELGMARLNRALEIDPQSLPALVLRGFAHERTDNPDAAKRDWARALELNEHCRPARENLARLEK